MALLWFFDLQKRGQKGLDLVWIWGHFGSFCRSFRRRFLVHFWVRFFSSLWAIWEPKGIPKGRFWEDILKLSGGHGQHVKIDVLCRRQLNSEGLGGSRNRRFLRRFSEGVTDPFWEGSAAEAWPVGKGNS